MSSKKKVLITDDEAIIALDLKKMVESMGYDANSVNDGKNCIETLSKEKYDIMLLDINLGDMTGIDVLEELNRLKIKLPVIIVSAFEKVSYAVEATKLGAYEYIVKPVDEKKLEISMKNAIKTFELGNQIDIIKEPVETLPSDGIIGSSPEFMNMLSKANKVAGYDVSVLITGESGTGKEVLAKYLHNKSDRRDKPFVAIDCASLPDSLVESELFGYVKGAFTNASDSKPGRFEMAQGGTVFLDEIGNLNSEVQKKLLRVLQERKIMRLGDKKEIEIDIRLICATNSDLYKEVSEGKFREDLMHRINVIAIELPPLRERGEDVILLAEYFINRSNIEFGKNIKGMSDDIKKQFLKCKWPGNIRQLENIIKHSIIMADEFIEQSHLPGSFHKICDRINCSNYLQNNNCEDPTQSLKDNLRKVEKGIIIKALEENNGNKSETAKSLKVDYKTLLRKIKELEIEDDGKE